MALQTIHLVFKTHLDIGFTDLARNVVRTYFDRFIPSAMETAQLFRRDESEDRYIWTTGSWLIYEYLEQAAPKERRRLERSIELGDISWHGLPFTTHSELMDASLFEYGLSLSQKLDKRFGKTTIAGKMTDVPGHSLGILAPLVQNGIEFLHIGVNSVCHPPSVPRLFVWKAPTGDEVVVMYSEGYGGIFEAPGTSSAIDIVHNVDETGEQDNLGPHTYEKAQGIFAEMRKQFPKAQVAASTLDAFAKDIRSVKKDLPVVTGEIGDTWIHGGATDPAKMSRFRELLRFRKDWLSRPMSHEDGERYDRFCRYMILVPEHTWGLDVKKHLADYSHYGQREFQACRSKDNFQLMEKSWDEQRQYLNLAVDALGETSMGQDARKRLESVVPVSPDKTGLELMAHPAKVIRTQHFDLSFDRATGSICHLVHRISGTSWSDPDHLIGRYRYQTFSQKDYDVFLKQYHTNAQDWSIPDFSKPGMAGENPESRFWMPEEVKIYMGADSSGWRFLAELTMPTIAVQEYGCPEIVSIVTVQPNSKASMEITVHWRGKQPSRLPEASWLGFNPRVPHPKLWRMDKMGLWISPYDVVPNGNRGLHGIQTGLKWVEGRKRIELQSLDAPLVAPGEPSLLCFDNGEPRMEKGWEFNLHNNVWGTNFPLWYGYDAMFRFNVEFIDEKGSE